MDDDTPAVPEAIARAIASVEPPDPDWSARAAARQSRLTMPPGSLGRLLAIGRQLAAIQRTDRPRGAPATVAIFAADHGVAEAGVSAYPQAVTGQMVANFAAGGAAVNVLSGRCGADVRVADLGVKYPVPGLERGSGYISAPIRAGTSNFLDGPAMSRGEAFRAFAFGLDFARRHVAGAYFAAVPGEMGIGNSTSAAALVAAFCGASAEAVVGRGTGVDDSGLARKREAVERGLSRHLRGEPDCWDLSARLGGFEILGLAGLIVGAAGARVLVLLDGLISSAAALIAARLCPKAVGTMLAAHEGTEPGHRVALESLGLEPLLRLGLRLGEGSGAALALPIVAASADLLRDMATFDSAGVEGPVENGPAAPSSPKP